MLYGIRKNEVWGMKNGKFFDDNEADRVGGIPLEVWRNPDTRWLDPANGIGNFPYVAFHMLDYQLGHHGPPKMKDRAVRRKHIVENMLYMIELDKGNVNTSFKIFEHLVPGSKPNICCADTLKLKDTDLERNFGVSKFHVVMGNPPFNKKQNAEGKRGGGDDLWMDFVEFSINRIIPNYYLVFVHPPSWRKPEYSVGRKVSKNVGMFKLIAHENQLHYLEMHDSKDGIKIFKAGTRYDFYILQKRPSNEPTIVKDVIGVVSKFDLKKFKFLPNFNIHNIIELFPENNEHSCELGIFNNKTKTYDNTPCVLYESSTYDTRKSWVSSKESGEFKYPLVHSTTLKGTRYMFSNTNEKGLFGIPKVIFGDSGINTPINDNEGKYGTTQHSIAIVVKDKEDGENLITFLKSGFFTNILMSCMWSSFQIDWRLFTYFKKNFWHKKVKLNESVIAVELQSEEQPQQAGQRTTRRKSRVPVRK